MLVEVFEYCSYHQISSPISGADCTCMHCKSLRAEVSRVKQYDLQLKS